VKYPTACHLHYLLIDKEVDYNEPRKSKNRAETAENGKEAKRQSPQSRRPESEGEINHKTVGKMRGETSTG
jgi:hypothetical protein